MDTVTTFCPRIKHIIKLVRGPGRAPGARQAHTVPWHTSGQPGYGYRMGRRGLVTDVLPVCLTCLDRRIVYRVRAVFGTFAAMNGGAQTGRAGSKRWAWRRPFM